MGDGSHLANTLKNKTFLFLARLVLRALHPGGSAARLAKEPIDAKLSACRFRP
jgi:hypothetical protein